MNVSFWWPANAGVSMCRSPWENITYEFIFVFPAILSSLAHFTYIVVEIGGKWLYSCCFVGMLLPGFAKNRSRRVLPINLFSMCFIWVQVVQPYYSTNTHLVRILILFHQWSNFPMVDNLSIVVHALPMHILTSLSVDEILLPRYMNWSTNFRVFQFYEEMIPSWLKDSNSILSEFA